MIHCGDSLYQEKTGRLFVVVGKVDSIVDKDKEELQGSLLNEGKFAGHQVVQPLDCFVVSHYTVHSVHIEHYLTNR